jgi:hypothetical protein
VTCSTANRSYVQNSSLEKVYSKRASPNSCPDVPAVIASSPTLSSIALNTLQSTTLATTDCRPSPATTKLANYAGFIPSRTRTCSHTNNSASALSLNHSTWSTTPPPLPPPPPPIPPPPPLGPRPPAPPLPLLLVTTTAITSHWRASRSTPLFAVGQGLGWSTVPWAVRRLCAALRLPD